MSQEVATFNKPRLPYHPEIETRYGVDKSGWKALVEAVYPSAKSVDSVVMALSYCRARNLDPFKRPVHIVPMWDTNKGTYVETVWPGISEIRTTAFRTKQYAGCDEAEFGPDITRTFTGFVGKRGREEEVSVEVTFPEWCRVTVYRELHGRVCRFVGPKIRWLESYAKRGRADVPNDMWEKRPIGQLEKCAEAAALRKAFPEEIGNQYAAEEMDGQRIMVDEREQPMALTPPEPPAPPPPPKGNGTPPPPPPKPGPRGPREPVAMKDPAHQAGFDMQAPRQEPADDGEPVFHEDVAGDHDPNTGEVIEHEDGGFFANYAQWVDDQVEALKAASDDGQDTIWNDEIVPRIEGGQIMPPDIDRLKRQLRNA